MPQIDYPVATPAGAGILYGAPADPVYAFTRDARIPRAWFHPDWMVRERDWRRFGVIYRGGEAFVYPPYPDVETLFRHEREEQRSFNGRLKSAYNRNHAKTIVGMKADAIFQPQVARAQDGDPTFEDWTKNVDLRGANADPFWNDVARWSMVYGTYWVGLAMPSAPALGAVTRAEGSRLATVAEARAARLRPYLYCLSPLSVIDWVEDEYGALEYAVVVEREVLRRALPKQREQLPEARLIARVLTRETEDRYAIGPQGGQRLISSTPHPFGAVPLVAVGDGSSQLEDIARIQVAVFNADSMITEQVRRQTFNQLVLKLEKPEEAMKVIIGTDAVLPLKQADSAEWLSPNVQTISAIREYVWELIDEMYAMANLRSRPGGKGQQPATDTSGIAYAFEWRQAETDLAGMATRLEEAELRLGAMRARAMGLDPAGFKATYPREFDIRALMARANEAVALAKTEIGPTAMTLVRKRLARKANPQMSAVEQQAVDREIDEIARGAAESPKPAGPPAPPNQGMVPPGEGAGEDRVERAMRHEVEVGEEVEFDAEG